MLMQKIVGVNEHAPGAVQEMARLIAFAVRIQQNDYISQKNLWYNLHVCITCDFKAPLLIWIPVMIRISVHVLIQHKKKKSQIYEGTTPKIPSFS